MYRTVPCNCTLKRVLLVLFSVSFQSYHKLAVELLGFCKSSIRTYVRISDSYGWVKTLWYVRQCNVQERLVLVTFFRFVTVRYCTVPYCFRKVSDYFLLRSDFRQIQVQIHNIITVLEKFYFQQDMGIITKVLYGTLVPYRYFSYFMKLLWIWKRFR